jgi:hypothetical protein
MDATTTDAGCITNPVTFEEYLNACPDPRVLGCFPYQGQLPTPLPPDPQ